MHYLRRLFSRKEVKQKPRDLYPPALLRRLKSVRSVEDLDRLTDEHPQLHQLVTHLMTRQILVRIRSKQELIQALSRHPDLVDKVAEVLRRRYGSDRLYALASEVAGEKIHPEEALTQLLQPEVLFGLDDEILQGINQDVERKIDYKDPDAYALALLTYAVTSHAGNPLNRGFAAFNLARQYLELDLPDEAAGIYEEALQHFRTIRAMEWMAPTLTNLGVAYRNMGDSRRAIGILEEALKLRRNTGDSRETGLLLGHLASSYRDDAQQEKAIEIFNQVLTISQRTGDSWLQGTSLGEIGVAYWSLGKADRAAEFIERGLEVLRKTGDKHAEGASLCNLANAYADLGQAERALELYNQALSISLQIEDRNGQAVCLLNLGNAYFDLAQLEEAARIYEQALKACREIRNLRGEGYCLSNLGNVYRDLGEDRQAADLLTQALQISRQLTDSHSECIRLGNLAGVYISLDELEKAAEHYEKALGISGESGYLRLRVSHLAGLGNVYHRLGRTVQAVEAIEEAIALLQQVGDESLIWRNAGILADVLTGEWGDYQRSFDLFTQAIGLVERARGRLGLESYRRDFMRDKARLYVEAVSAGILAGKNTLALNLLEKGKTRYLAESLSRRDAISPTIPSDLRLRHQQFYEEVQQHQHAYQSLGLDERYEIPAVQSPQQHASLHAHVQSAREKASQTKSRRDAILNRLETAERELAAVEANIRQVDPAFHQIAQTVPLTFSQIRQLIHGDEQTAILEFAVSRRGVAVFVVTWQEAQKPEVVWIPEFTSAEHARLLAETDDAGELLDGWLVNYLNRKNSRSDFQRWLDTIERVSGELGELVWRKVDPLLQKKGIRRLILIPHLWLHVLPLHLMAYEGGSQKRCVIRDYEVSFVPSATVLGICQERETDKNRRSARGILIVSDPTDNLPFAHLEAGFIENISWEKGLEPRRLDGEGASRGAVLADVPGKAYIHIAGHATYSWDDPLNSAILLFGKLQGDNFVTPDPLTLLEIQRSVDLRSTCLVTLSACETGLTDPSNLMDEMVGLPGGFLMAGVPELIASLWSVDDLSTSLLMGMFYDLHLGQGHPPANALRQAQLWLSDLTAGEMMSQLDVYFDGLSARGRIDDLEINRVRRQYDHVDPAAKPFAHPYYWGAFITIGASNYDWSIHPNRASC